MSKSLVLAAFAALFMILTFPAAAQNAPVSEIPAGGAAAAKVPAPVGAYNAGVGPINLRYGAYITRNAPPQQKAASTQDAGRLSFPEQPSSAAAYNQRLTSSKVAAQRRKDSVIPSPFPDNF